MTANGTATLGKGEKFEEHLRGYFLKLNYYAVRAVKLTFESDEVTDIDLWLYSRPSVLTRERINVDAKNRGSPKAMERIFWAKGAQLVLNFERSIVATTDTRSSVKDYGERHGVLVLDGGFISRLVSNQGALPTRMTEEEFVASVAPAAHDKLLEHWKRRLVEAKSRLVSQLDFNGCNAHIEDLKQAMLSVADDRDQRRSSACRIMYLLVSYFLISLDYSTRTIVFEDNNVRKKDIENRLRYGKGGRREIDERIGFAAKLIDAYAPDARSIREAIKSGVSEGLQTIPAHILADFFCRTEVAAELFNQARAFEANAYSYDFVAPLKLDSMGQSIVGVLLDYHAIDRRAVFDSWQT